ncbi:MAG TPA: hypothetical protein VMH01_05150 [Puia sp.]|nr:hypothetical protein [Puia sp.]
MKDDHVDILALIPQRPPMVMVDKLLYSDEKISRSVLQIREGNIFVENSALSEAGLVENIAQTAAARIGYISMLEKKPAPLGYIGAVQHLEIKSLPKINEEIKTEITIKNEIFNVTVICGEVSCNEKPIAQCEMKIFITNQQ